MILGEFTIGWIYTVFPKATQKVGVGVQVAKGKPQGVAVGGGVGRV